MFGKLKDKLKSALSVFSSKTEEEAEDIPQEEVDKIIAQKEEKLEAKEKSGKKKTVSKKKEKAVEEAPEEKIDEFKEEVAPELIRRAEEESATETEVDAKVMPHVAKVERKVEESVIENSPTKVKKEISKSVKEKEIIPIKVKEEFKPKEKEIETLKEAVVKEKEESKVEKKEVQAEDIIKEAAQEAQSNKVASADSKNQEPKKGFFGRFKETLTTKKINAEKFEELFWDLEMVLLESNVSVKVIEKIKIDLQEELVDKPLPRDVMGKIQEVLKKTLHEILSVEQIDLLSKIDEKKKEGKPFVIMFFGINGAGKTTSIAKLTHLLQSKKYSVVLAAGDTFRAAAIQQLEEHANKLGVKMIKHDYGSDAAAVAFDAVQYAEKSAVDVVLIDTAGRLHSNTNLMNELDKINRVAKPDFKVFVGESITGNDCIEQAEKFNELVQLDGAILTKADIDENGGAPLSIAYTIKKPILYLGMGQEYKDLEKFNPDLILERLGFD